MSCFVDLYIVLFPFFIAFRDIVVAQVRVRNGLNICVE